MVPLGHFQRLLKERHSTFQAEEVFTLKHGLSIKRNTLHLYIMHPTGGLHHGLIGGLRGSGIIADFIGPTELAVQVMQARHRDIHSVLIY